MQCVRAYWRAFVVPVGEDGDDEVEQDEVAEDGAEGEDKLGGGGAKEEGVGEGWGEVSACVRACVRVRAYL